VLAADKRIDALARALKKAGAPGTLEQLRAKVFIALLTGRPIYALLPGEEDGPDQCDGSGGTRRPGQGTGPFAGGPGTAWPAGPGFPPGLAGSVNLTIPLATWLGLAGQPGDAAGHGPLDAGTSRDLAAFLAGQPGNRWCLTITGPGGHAIGHGCARAGPPAGTSVPPGSPGGPAPPGTTGPPGKRAGPGPPGQRAGPGSTRQPRSTGPPAADDARVRWLAGITIKWLETGNCSHQRETRSYRPSNLVRHLVKTRDRTCSFPGCRRPARKCDDDHTLPFDQGGRSCECNLSPACKS
jgi:hypothetical protein